MGLSSVGAPMVLDVAAMFLNTETVGADLLVNCQGTVNRHEKFKDSKMLAWGCEYLEAYVLGFPEICIVALLLFIGRQIAHHRFYYGMLKAGGVLNYNGSSMLQDPVILLLVWCYTHVVCYAGFVYFSANFNVTDVLAKKDQFEVVPNSKPESLLKLFVSFIGFILLPAGFFLIFLGTNYQLRTSLVQLSEYVGDNEDADLGDGLKILTAMGEGATRQVVQAETLPDACGIEQIYTLTIERFQARPKDGSPKAMSLLTCLWPLRVLLSPSIHGAQAINFRWLWGIFVVIAMLFYMPQAVRLSNWSLKAAFLGA